MGVAQKLSAVGIKLTGPVHRNLSTDELVKRAIERGEGELSNVGALTVTTGKYTGRSPNDRFIVQTSENKKEINWSKVNLGISEKNFEKLYDKITEYMSELPELFVFDGYAGADKDHMLHVRVINELASQNLFIKNLLRRPNQNDLEKHEPAFHVLAAPGCKIDNPADYGLNSEAFIILNFDKKVAIIGGSQYSGEIKKSLFTVMNYYLPKNGIFPMHCSANIGKEKGDSALFFGLSGTGKTTLSADPNRILLGDDEHGWCEKGIFNFEGGCYAKCINLKKEDEPQIWGAIKHGALVENVIMDAETKEYDFTNAKLTENTRAGFPIEHISNADPSGIANHPETIIFLTADAFGVLPPVARLDKKAAMYHFLSGYTSKLAGTERGITEPKAAFSAFFGEPFMPLKPMVYARMLKKYVSKNKTRVFLVNTGWVAGPYGKGHRISIKDTRAIITSILNGELDNMAFKKHEFLNIDIPETCPGVKPDILNPKNLWTDKDAYDRAAKTLADMFKENIKKFKGIPKDIIASGPK